MTYTAAQRAEAVGLALAYGDKAAAKQLGIPRRTVTHWRGHATDPGSPNAVVVMRSREDVAAKVWAVFVDGVEELGRRVHDPETRAGDLARIVDVLGERYALLAGGPTANVNVQGNAQSYLEALSADDAKQLADVLDAAIAERSLATVRTDPLALSREDVLGLINAIESRLGDGS